MRESDVHPSLSFEVPSPSPPSRSRLWPRVNQGPTAMISPHLRPATALDLRKTSFAPTQTRRHIHTTATSPSFSQCHDRRVSWHLRLLRSHGIFSGLPLVDPHISAPASPSGGVPRSLLFLSCNMTGERTTKIRASETQGDGAPTPEWQKDARHYLFYLSSERYRTLVTPSASSQAWGPADGYDYGDCFVGDDDEDVASGGCNQEEDENTGKIKLAPLP
ncbi:hypothetical protein B0H13DRAFT_2083624 [Mycena leptocephala]|nr:hypothetical protein B0H13DRAFT_2083624 [Mycena leptocephala]